MSSSDCYNTLDNIYNVLVSLVIKYLRKKYPATKPEAAGVMERLVDLSGNYPKFVQKVKDGDADQFQIFLRKAMISAITTAIQKNS